MPIQLLLWSCSVDTKLLMLAIAEHSTMWNAASGGPARPLTFESFVFEPAGSAAERTGAASSTAPTGTLNARLATLERSISAANKLTPASGRITSSAAVAVPSSSQAVGPQPSSSVVDSSFADRLAAIEAQLSQLRQPETIPSLRSNKSLGFGPSPSMPGASLTQLVQSDSALKEQLSQLQQQIESLMSGKADKADVNRLQLHAAMLGGGSSGSGSGSGSADIKDSSEGVHGAAPVSSGGSGSGGACCSWCLLEGLTGAATLK